MKKAKVSSFRDGVSACFVDEDGEPVDESSETLELMEQLREKLTDTGADTTQMEACCDGSVWVGDVDADDVANALMGFGHDVETEEIDCVSGRGDEE